MKKHYIEPQTIEMILSVSQMVCTSTPLTINDKSTNEEGITEADSRRPNIWADEDEEEDF